MESIKINQDEVITKNRNKFSKKIAESSILNFIFKYLLIFLLLLFIINEKKLFKMH